MTNLDPTKIGRRAQDIQTGLRDVSDPLVSATIPVTGQVGMAALLAVHIRGLDVITNVPGFYRLAESLGINVHALPLVLRYLQDAGWVRVSPSPDNPKRVEESVPLFQELYATLGQQWQARAPGELEVATLALVEALTVAPIPVEAAATGLGVGLDALVTISEIGELGGYVREYTSPREQRRILYTPLFMDEHPERVLNFCASHSEADAAIRAVFAEAQAAPGIAVADLAKTHPLVLEMIDANIIAAPAVDSSGGRHSFLFPQAHHSVDPAIVNKARVLLACVRYGQKFSTVTKIDDGVYLLERLRDNKLIGKTPHSDIGTQYQPAADLGLGFIETVPGPRFRFRLYDTEDNVTAVQLAIDMARGQTEPPAQRLLGDTEVRATFAQESVAGVILPGANRFHARGARASRRLDPRSKTAQRAQAELLDDLRGVRRVR
jgi:hypothetical protein